MLFLRQSSVQLFRRIVARLRALKVARASAKPFIAASYLHIPSYPAAIHRDVTPNGVRVYSLCGECGSRLRASATLCDECAQKRSRPARPY